MAVRRLAAVGSMVIAIAFSAACGGDQAGGGGASPVTTPTGDAASPTDDPAPPRAGPAYEFVDNDGFRYTLALYALATVDESMESPSQVAPPGQTYAAFSARLTNLQTDRAAPWPSFAVGGSSLTFAVPEGTLTGSRANWQCDAKGVVGCIRGVSRLSCSQAQGEQQPERLPLYGADPMAAGGSVTLRCYTRDTVPALDASELRVYHDTADPRKYGPGDHHEVRRPE